MSSPRHIIAEGARLVAAELPPEQVEAVARAIEAADASRWPQARGQILGSITHAYYRSLVGDLLDRWHATAPGLGPQAVALALTTAAVAEAARRDESIDLVWTGPDAEAVPLLHTEQAILQVLDAAVRRLTVVSYAVYRIPRIAAALVRAADRGVVLTVILETPDRGEGQNAYDTLRALGGRVAARARVYLWPPEKRPQDEAGRCGSLHVKCVAADGFWLFLSSPQTSVL
jgi:phosphatidylserine/phosphatidylglycerophosphate/cardiolipin synthase-like enzyme